MKSLKFGTLYAVVSAAAIGIAACAGENAGPGSMLAPTSASLHAVGDAATATPSVGHLVICKSAESNVAGEFTVSRTAFGPASDGTVGTGSITVEPGQCKVAATDVSPSGSASDIVINETSEGFVSASYVGTDAGESGTYVDNTTSLRINPFHGYTVTYTNFVHPPVEICTYTKGWYHNKNGSPTIIDLSGIIAGLTIPEQRTIFGATPGKPNGVTWTGGNNTLNLYQQLLAALNNLGGDVDAGPAAVDEAVDDALAAITLTNLHISVAAGTDVSGLIDVLSKFNQGEYENYPHCEDEAKTVN